MKKTVLITIIALISISGYSQSVEDRAKILFFAAEEAFNIENYAECIEKLESIEKLLGSTNSMILELKIRAYFENQNYLEAYIAKNKFFEVTDRAFRGYDNILRMVISIDNNAFEYAYPKAVDLFNSRNFFQSMELFKHCVEIQPENFELNLLIAKSYYEIAYYKDAADFFKKASELNPNHKEARYYYLHSLARANTNEQQTAWATEQINAIEQPAFQDAINKNSIEGYEQFKKEFHLSKLIKEADNKLIDLCINNARNYTEAEKESDAIKYCDYYIENYPRGEFFDEMKEIKQKAYYILAEKQRAAKENTAAVNSYKNSIAVKDNGAFYDKSKMRLKDLEEEIRINNLKQAHYKKAMQHKRKASFKGVPLLATVSAGAVLGSYLLFERGLERQSLGEEYGMHYIGAVVLGLAGTIWSGFTIYYFGQSINHSIKYRKEMRKYNNFQVSLEPVYYPKYSNSFGVALNIRF